MNRGNSEAVAVVARSGRRLPLIQISTRVVAAAISGPNLHHMGKRMLRPVGIKNFDLL